MLLAFTAFLTACPFEDDSPDMPSDTNPTLLPGFSEPVVCMNAYYLQEVATRAIRSEESSTGEPVGADFRADILEEVFQKTKDMGASCLRTNGHNDDPDKEGDTAIQPRPGEYDETSFKGLDLVLCTAARYEIPLFLTLGNHFSAYGGAEQYVEWAGLPSPKIGDSRFYRDADVRELYKNNIDVTLSRETFCDGQRYGEHEAVLGYELANEPRGNAGTGLDENDKLDEEGEEMLDWVEDIATFVNERIATDILVSTGEEGFDVASAEGYDRDFWSQQGNAENATLKQRSSFRKHTLSPTISAASMHMYAESDGYGFGENPVEAGCRYIQERTAIASEAQKPVVLGEFALPHPEDESFDDLDAPMVEEWLEDLERRRGIYAEWLSCAKEAGTAASLPWMLCNDGSYKGRSNGADIWDTQYCFFWLDDEDGNRTEASDPRNRYVQVILDATGE